MGSYYDQMYCTVTKSKKFFANRVKVRLQLAWFKDGIAMTSENVTNIGLGEGLLKGEYWALSPDVDYSDKPTSLNVC